MGMWQQIGLGLIAAAALLFFLPAALRSHKKAKSATSDDWKGVLIPLGLVILFVILLVMLVR